MGFIGLFVSLVVASSNPLDIARSEDEGYTNGTYKYQYNARRVGIQNERISVLIGRGSLLLFIHCLFPT
jgi:hypothetical protein